MTAQTTQPSPAPRAPAASRRGSLIAGAIGLAVLAAIAIDTTIVPIGSEADVRQQAFSPDSFGTSEFPRVQAFILEKAVEAQTLAPAVLADKAVAGLEANLERAAALAGMSPSTVTPLNRLIGYEAAAKIAKHSVAKGITVREAVVDLGYVERGEVSEADLDKALDLLSMTHPGVAK